MSKPFEPEEAKIAEEKTKELIKILNRVLKKYIVEEGPGKNHDIVFICKSSRSIEIYADVEVARHNRWEKLKKGEYKTARWPIAKKDKCEEKYLRRGLLAIMLTFNRENPNEMFYIDCETWIKEGKEEGAVTVRTERRVFRFRRETPEKFWAIDRERVVWGIENLERFLDDLLKRKGMLCQER